MGLAFPLIHPPSPPDLLLSDQKVGQRIYPVEVVELREPLNQLPLRAAYGVEFRRERRWTWTPNRDIASTAFLLMIANRFLSTQLR